PTSTPPRARAVCRDETRSPHPTPPGLLVFLTENTAAKPLPPALHDAPPKKNGVYTPPTPGMLDCPAEKNGVETVQPGMLDWPAEKNGVYTPPPPGMLDCPAEKNGVETPPPARLDYPPAAQNAAESLQLGLRR